MAEKANHPVRTTSKSLALIEKLDELNGVRIHELEERLEMTKGAIHNHLSTLREHGYVMKEGNKYYLSYKFLSLGGRIRRRSPLYRIGREKVNQLANDTGMLANLMTEESGRGVYLYQARGDYGVNLDTHVGYRISLHNTGIGKAILAYLTRDRVEEIIETWGLLQTTENTITDRQRLFEELEQIRDRGYAADHEERTEGLTCIGAPVRLEEELLGAISISAPTRRLGNNEFDEDIIAAVESTANEIALDIKYQ
jgi:IclR family acetate operon transcriptional repressor